jgi:hypothetical protein
MGINIGQVSGQRIGDFKGLENIRLLEVDLLGDSADTVLLLNICGDDTAPVVGDMVVVFDFGSFRFSVAIWDLVAAAANTGDKKLYSRDSGGSIAATLNLLNSGQLELNGSGDFAVRYTALEAAFNQLKSDFDTHVHGGVTGGSSSTSTTTPSTADITGAKIDEIEVPT